MSVALGAVTFVQPFCSLQLWTAEAQKSALRGLRLPAEAAEHLDHAQ